MWGVGPAKVRNLSLLFYMKLPIVHFMALNKIYFVFKAWELVDMGYKNIIDVRNALEVRALDLSAGARVGVQFYEDFQGKMGRFEVRMISKIVEEAIKKYFPTAEVMTMGSYRRGKQLCGDVDILITHREYTRTVPLGALDELVERLKSNGHISHHLTHVDTKYFYAMLSQEGEFHPSIFPPHHDSQSYMGVFNSPSIKGKHRRIDIKFYPYQQKAFAMMYFTGNGYFNRSIRLYAKRHKSCRLNDHGLFPDHLGGGKSLKAKDEQEVFDKLGLVYKEPKDRNGFDDVVEKETNQVFIIEDVNKNEIMSEEKIARDVKWVD
jgi:DNA polymerase/3'-5' exonuclease PolX